MDKNIVAIAFLTESNLRAIGKNLERIYPIDSAPAFEDLLAALDEAERRVGAGGWGKGSMGTGTWSRRD
jgi:hypothetical protein